MKKLIATVLLFLAASASAQDKGKPADAKSAPSTGKEEGKAIVDDKKKTDAERAEEKKVRDAIKVERKSDMKM